MAQIIEEKTKTVTSKCCVRRSCDLCGVESRDADSWRGEWGADAPYRENETEIKIEVRQKEGTSCPDGGSGTKYEIDLCPDCFKNRLVPWLRSQGAKIEEKEWDW